MNRRHFLRYSSAAAASLPFVHLPSALKDKPMGVIVHSYAHRWNPKVKSEQYPSFTNAIDMIEHCHRIGAGGVQVIVKDWGQDFSKKVRERREKLGLYIEGSIGLPKNASEVAQFEKDILAAREAGAEVVRTVCLGGRRYETFQALSEFEEFRKNSLEWIRLAEPVVRRHKIKLALENHKDWRAQEMLAILKQFDSEWIGVNLDFGNNIALMEDPMEVAKTLAPYVFSTHVKDMAVEEYEDGFLLSEVPLGKGFLDLARIYELCRAHNRSVNFNLEMITRDPLKIPCLTDDYWSTFAQVKPQELAGTLHMVKKNLYGEALPRVSQLSEEQKLAAEEHNIVSSLKYSRDKLEE